MILFQRLESHIEPPVYGCWAKPLLLSFTDTSWIELTTMPLSAEELAFFENLSTPKTSEPSQAPAQDSLIAGLSSLSTDTSTTVSSSAKEQLDKDNDDEDDDFGDFESAETSNNPDSMEKPKPAAPDWEELLIRSTATPETSLPLGLEIASAAPVEFPSVDSGNSSGRDSLISIDEAYQARESDLAFDRDVMAQTSGISVLGAQKKALPSIGEQVVDISSYSSNIKFGQHVVSSKNPYTGAVEQKTTSTTPRQWKKVLSAKPAGDENRNSRESYHSKSGKTGVEPSPSGDLSSMNKATPSKKPNDQLIDLDPWSFDTQGKSDDDFDDFNDFEVAPSVAIPSPLELMEGISANVLPVLQSFLNSLIPLAYPLKRKAMKKPQFLAFLPGFLEIILVAGRIMAGRARRSISASQKSDADRAANQLEDTWTKLRSRLDSLLPANHGYRLLSISSTAVFNSSTTATTCIICGLAKNELIRGEKPNKKWSTVSGGHETCIKYWEYRNKNCFIEDTQ